MIGLVPRAATTSDAFNAIAEPRRRDILAFLAADERPVGDIVDSLGMGQPAVSKHLKVLRDVGLVHVRREGRQMLYRTNADAIRPLHEWAAMFERYWRHQLLRVKGRAEAKERAHQARHSHQTHPQRKRDTQTEEE
jgi:DNA-binding transcriptional ArsR family regulator